MRSAPPTLLLLDGTCVVRRVYESVPGEDGPARVEGAIIASMRSIARALSQHQPTHFLAAFDHEGPTWRHDLKSDFKATRKPMYPGLRDALPSLYAMIEAEGLRWTSPKGVEADDVLATVATRAAARGFNVVVATNDVDMCELLSSSIQVYNHFAREWRDEAWLLKNWGILPSQIPDAMALIGVKNKNVAGVDNLGNKKAAKLLQEYVDLEGVLANALQMPGKLGPVIHANADACRLAKRLFTLKRDVDLTLRPSELMVKNVPPPVSTSLQGKKDGKPALLPSQSTKATDFILTLQKVSEETPAEFVARCPHCCTVIGVDGSRLAEIRG